MNKNSEIKQELICNLLKNIDSRHLDFILQVVQGEFIPPGEKGTLENMTEYTRAELTHATQGPASEADAAARLAICMRCEHRATDYKGQTDPVGWCQRCGCGANPRAKLTVKVTLAGASCPLTPPKWEAVKGTGATLASAVDAFAGVTKSIIHKLSGG